MPKLSQSVDDEGEPVKKRSAKEAPDTREVNARLACSVERDNGRTVPAGPHGPETQGPDGRRSMMKRLPLLFALAALLLGGAATAEAGGRKGPGWGKPAVGVYVAPRYWGPRPWWGPGWYGFRPWPAYPYYYPYAVYSAYPAPVIVQRDPQVYVQQALPAQAVPTAPEPAQPQPADYWYYCEDTRGYYPYVQQCPRGWMTVVPPASPR